jgi:hypothetical protein
MTALVLSPDGAHRAAHIPGSEPTNQSACSSPEYSVATEEVTAQSSGNAKTKRY